MIANLLESFSGQVAILGREGEIVDCNRHFAEALVQGTPVLLDPDGRVSFPKALDLQTYREALLNRTPVTFCTRDLSTEPIVITVHPLKPLHPLDQSHDVWSRDTRDDFVLICIVAAKPKKVSLDFLRARYHLTSAEIRVSEMVVRGLALNETAELIGVSKVTVRNQLTSALSKLGVKRQAQFVSVILNMFPRLSCPASAG